MDVESAPPTTTTPQKVCTGCGKDVSGVKRFKDLDGNYYCEPCWNEHRARETEKARVAKAAARATETMPSSSSPSQPPSAFDATDSEQSDPDVQTIEEAPADPLLAALAVSAADNVRKEAQADLDSGKPIPPPRRKKGPGAWFMWTIIIVGVILLAACAILLILVIKGPEKPAPKPVPASMINPSIIIRTA